MKSSTLGLLTLPLSLILVACGAGGGSSMEPTSENQILTQELDGTWASSCQQNNNTHSIDTLTFTEDKVIIKYEEFLNPECSGTPTSSAGAKGTYSLGNTVETSTGETATEINYTLTIQNETFVSLDLIQVNGDSFYTGKYIDHQARTNELELDVIMVKQKEI